MTSFNNRIKFCHKQLQQLSLSHSICSPFVYFPLSFKSYFSLGRLLITLLVIFCILQSLGGEAGAATLHAIDVGYRHFDTACLYENEKEVGEAVQQKIKEGVVKREDIFIVTKLWNTEHEPENVEAACRASCKEFGMDYIDLYLMHYPVAFKKRTPFDFWPLNPDGQHEHA